MSTEQFEKRRREAVDLWSAGEFEGARAAFEECVSYDRLGPTSSPEEVEQAKVVLLSWLQYGQFLLETGKPEEAIFALSRGMAFGHFQSVGGLLLARCYQELGDHEQAAEALRQSLALDPSPEVWVLLYWELLHCYNVEEARQCLHRALELDPEYDEAHYNLGCCALRDRDWKLAESHFRRALRADPDDAKAHAQLGHVLMQPHLARDDDDVALDEAERHLRLAIALDPDYFWARLYLGNLCIRRANPGEAETHLRKAVEIEPESEQAHLALGQLLGSQDRYDEALSHLRLAGQLRKPDRAMTRDEMTARVEDELGRFRVRPAVGALRSFLVEPREEMRVCPYDGSLVTVTIIAQINANVTIGYRYSKDVSKWGVFFFDPEQPDTLGVENYWYLLLEDAFYNCPGWNGDLPPSYVIA